MGLGWVIGMGRKTSALSPKLSRLLIELKKSNLRVTESRVALLEALADRHGPFTVEEIHSKFIKKSCDLATIYRSLASLEKVGMIRRCEFGDGTARFELSERESHHHHHVICKLCRQVVVLDDCELQDIDRIAQKRGFTEISHSLEFFGVCPECQS
jgi:Fur family ferric uptake transcriptional regulator